MVDQRDFHNLTSSEESSFVNHNPTDYDNFRRFQEENNARFEQLEQERAKKEIIKNIKLWESQLPERWSKAILTKVSEPAEEAAQKIINIFKTHEKSSLFVSGPSGVGKTYLSYAAIRRCIGLNWLGPSQVKIISEDTLLGYASSGFEGQARFNKILDRRHSLIFLDGVNKKGVYTQKEQQMWEQIVDHVYNNSLILFITSNGSLDDFSSKLSDSAESKLSQIFAHGVVTLNDVEIQHDRHSKESNASQEFDSYGLFDN